MVEVSPKTKVDEIEEKLKNATIKYVMPSLFNDNKNMKVEIQTQGGSKISGSMKMPTVSFNGTLYSTISDVETALMTSSLSLIKGYVKDSSSEAQFWGFGGGSVSFEATGRVKDGSSWYPIMGMTLSSSGVIIEYLKSNAFTTKSIATSGLTSTDNIAVTIYTLGYS